MVSKGYENLGLWSKHHDLLLISTTKKENEKWNGSKG
jgi:hypothetical protein